MKRVFVGPLLHLVYRPWVRGAENVPEEGAAILASNHLAVIDSFFLPLVLDRELVFIGKQEYFTGPGVKGRLTAGFMRGVGTIPVDRGGGKASEAALRTGLRRLADGDLFGIYPEGTRSPDGRLYRGKTGIARLALESGAPVIPVAMVGTDEAQPPGPPDPEGHAHRRRHRRAARLQPLPGHGERPVHPALGDRRDHVRDHEPVRARSTSTCTRRRRRRASRPVTPPSRATPPTTCRPLPAVVRCRTSRCRYRPQDESETSVG